MPRRCVPVRSICGALTLLALCPGAALAHGFGRLYNLPVPFWLYAWGAGAALILSFLVAACFAAAPAAAGSPNSSPGAGLRVPPRALAVLKFLSVFLLALTIATGLFGYRDPARNFSMTFFWVIFTLLFTYLTALTGNLYGAINPWRVMAAALDRRWRGFAAGRWAYPAWFGSWPALALYLGFIWFELLGHGRPFSLGALLLGYSLLNLAGVWAVGAGAWFRHCELFAVFLRLVGLMAPLYYRDGALRWRAPFSGLVHERPAGLGVVAFALAMLATTAMDGLFATQWWVGLFWSDGRWLSRLIGEAPIMAYASLIPWYVVWNSAWLLASPLIYLAAYLVTIVLAKWLARSARPLRELALDFGYTLMPIALVYHMTHYATLILTQGVKIVSLLSDPFGWRWNLFGTAQLWRAPILPDMGLVWHTQVGLILFGHIVSIVVAHRIALRVFPGRGQALASQLPMLLLMVAFTVFGLWILAQPLTALTMR